LPSEKIIINDEKHCKVIAPYLSKEAKKLFDLALKIAIQTHRDEKDKSGREYVMHPMRVAERCKDPRAKVVALLN